MSGIVWWDVAVTDPEAFQRFHGALWGWGFRRAFEDSELNEEHWIISVDGQALGGLQRADAGRTPCAGVRLCVEVDDLEQTLHRGSALGGQVERGRTDLGGADGWFATTRDPTGVSFGLWTSRGGRLG